VTTTPLFPFPSLANVESSSESAVVVLEEIVDEAAADALAIARDRELAELLERARVYVASSKATSTRRAYAIAYRTFALWCEARHLPSLPAAPGTVAIFLATLADAGRAVNTIEKHLAAVAHVHREHGIDWSSSAPAVRETMAGIRRRLAGAVVMKKAPARDEELAALVATLGDDLSALRDRALLTLGWFAASRRSEIVALDVGDVVFEREGLRVNVRRSKGDQQGIGMSKGIPFAGDPLLCPVRALRAWLDAATIAEGAIFRGVDQKGRISEKRLCDRTVARIVQRTAESAGLDPALFAGHSLRAGFITTAAKRGKSLDAIMRQTRQKSVEVVRGYIRHATIFDDNAASGLV
jgi:integrase